ncbi:MAG: hypothetical protein QF926_04680 [Alphaproteobacteria bacterium]|jgi:hypothetical protein|nr:hypothetical protein [Alphaproteobacteria bacterium]|tara:strand:+ start:84 stop:275 length:192 start_codon:yes stop_codon:yes gene_type:complete
MPSETSALSAAWHDVWLLDGVRTPFPITVVRELVQTGPRGGIALARIGGGHGIAVLVADPDAA